MLKQTAIALSLSMVAAAGMAAQDSMSAESSMSVKAEFQALDTNGDGVISRSEAKQSPALAESYDSFDTDATIENEAKNGASGGITLEQFEAGMQAAHSQRGVVGSAVSGGQSYTLMKDGTKKMNDSMSGMKNQAGSALESAKDKTMGSDIYDGSANSSGGDSMSSMKHGAMQKSESMHRGVNAKAKTMGSERFDDSTSSMQGDSMSNSGADASGTSSKQRTMGSERFDDKAGDSMMGGDKSSNVNSDTDAEDNY